MKKPKETSAINRRHFLANIGVVAVSLPTFISALALGRGGNQSPNGNIIRGVVSWGMQAPGNTQSPMGSDCCQVAASCNIDRNHLERSIKAINEHYVNNDCKGYHDYREMMAQPDIDAATIAVPDNWHELIAVEALKRTWVNPAKMEPYIKARSPINWRWNYNTGGGQLSGWIGLHCDIAHWGFGFDLKGPLEIEGHDEFPDPKALWKTAGRYRIEEKYPQDIKFIIACGDNEIKGGTKWIGTDGWVHINRDNQFDSSNPDLADCRSVPDDLAKIRFYKPDNHTGNFLECVRSLDDPEAARLTACDHHTPCKMV
jgi:predicted dehydrogenase